MINTLAQRAEKKSRFLGLKSGFSIQIPNS